MSSITIYYILCFKRCIESIDKNADYDNYEIIIVDKGSTEQDILDYYEALEKKSIVKILYTNKEAENDSVGYASDYNYGVENSSGEYFVFMSSVCEIINNKWLYTFLCVQQYENIGLTGCGINYTDESGNHMYFSGMHLIGSDCETVRLFSDQRGKLVLCPDELLRRDSRFKWRSVTALDSVCVMIKKDLYNSLGGFDKRFPYTLFVFDLCLKSRALNLYNAWINVLNVKYVQLKDIYVLNAMQNYATELETFRNLWRHELDKEDPFFNRNFSIENFRKNDCLFNIQNEGKE